MRLDDSADDVHTRQPLGAGGFEHRERLADAGGGAEEDLQLAAAAPGLLLSDAKQELVGIGPALGHDDMECTAVAGSGGSGAQRRRRRARGFDAILMPRRGVTLPGRIGRDEPRSQGV